MENDPSLYQTSAIIPWSFGFNIPSVLTVFHRSTTINSRQPTKMPSDFLNTGQHSTCRFYLSKNPILCALQTRKSHLPYPLPRQRKSTRPM